MAKLRLINPDSPDTARKSIHPIQVDVAVSVPAIHLDGEYSYLAAQESVTVGSLVQVPFAQGETFGFVTRVSSEPSLSNLKWIKKVLVADPLFDDRALIRYRRIAFEYGSSLISILKLGVPIRKSSRLFESEDRPSKPRKPSAADARFLHSLFEGDWDRLDHAHLLIPVGMLWDQVAVSLFLGHAQRTVIMVPTELDIKNLSHTLQQRGVSDFVTVSSSEKRSSRHQDFLRLSRSSPNLVIGTRAVAFAPVAPELIVIVDPGHDGYQERRSPYSRGDDIGIWDGRIITLNHSRQMSHLAAKERYFIGKGRSKVSYATTSIERIVDDLRRELVKVVNGATVLLSVNDASFATGLRCARCLNSTRCDCGFPLRIPHRGSDPTCSKCLKIFETYRCPHCGGSEVRATRGGSRSLALSLAKSIKGARIVISEPTNAKAWVERKQDQITIVIAQQACEPRVTNSALHPDGYDIVALVGGRSGFNSSTLNKNDRFRMRWARIRGLVHPRKATFLLDVDPDHPEFVEFRDPSGGRGLEILLRERKELQLPPFSLLVEIKGSDGALHQLRQALALDPLFRDESSVIFPVHEGRIVIKVSSNRRQELIRLLQTLTRLRSSKRLDPIQFVVSPPHL